MLTLKQVFVHAYIRYRLRKFEHVRKHYRKFPNLIKKILWRGSDSCQALTLCF